MHRGAGQGRVYELDEPHHRQRGITRLPHRDPGRWPGRTRAAIRRDDEYARRGQRNGVRSKPATHLRARRTFFPTSRRVPSTLTDCIVQEIGLPGVARNFAFLKPGEGTATRLIRWIPEMISRIIA
jgi:hypothetical protein